MKLNNKGFAISTVMYIILIMAVILITITLTLLSHKKLILDNIQLEAKNNIYNAYDISYREALQILKSEALVYATENNITKDSVKISNLNSSIDKEILDGYKLSEKYLTIVNNTNDYNIYLGKTKKVSSNNEKVENLLDIVDYKIEGNTYQETRKGINLLNNNYIEEVSSTIGSLTGATVNSEYIDIVRMNMYDYARIPITLKANKTYTVWYEYQVYDRPQESTGKTYLGLGFLAKGAKVISINENTKGYYAQTITIEEDTETYVRVYANYGSEVPAKVKFRIMVVEGEYTTDTIPKYEEYGATPTPEIPSKIESVGDYDESNGKYKIPIKVNGKNLFNKGNLTDYGYTGKVTTIEGKNCAKIYDGANNGFNIYGFKENTQYTISFSSKIVNTKGHVRVIAYYTDGTSSNIINATGSSAWQNHKATTNSSKSLSYLKVNNAANGENWAYYINLDDIQIEEGTSVTDYEQYKTVITNIYIDEPLRKVGDYFDYISYGEQNIERKLSKKEFIGNEVISIHPTSSTNPNGINTYLFQVGTYSDSLFKNAIPIFSTHYKNLTNISVGNVSEESARLGRPSENRRALYIANSAVDAASFKEFLADEYQKGNPVVFLYPSASSTPQPTEIPKINIGEGNFTIGVNTNILPSNVEFTVIEKIKEI